MCDCDSVSDVEGNKYASVRIGNQCWTVENLRTRTYRDGSFIPYISDTSGWSRATTGAYCYYGNNTANGSKYGALYNWYAVSTGNLAPSGWHIPSLAEWNILSTYLMNNGYNYDSTLIGNKYAKSMAAQTDWVQYTGVGAIGNDLSSNNRSGFSALPGGSRDTTGAYGRNLGRPGYGQGQMGFWWCADEWNPQNGNMCSLEYRSIGLTLTGFFKKNGFSVRLVKDNN
jgi:uncharacterized protein (TIGR02145 family)